MKSAKLKFLVLKELNRFNEFRPSKDCWVSANSIIEGIGVKDMPFARSTIQSLIEDELINQRKGEKLPDGQFELLVQINSNGKKYLESFKFKLRVDPDSISGKIIVGVSIALLTIIGSFILYEKLFPKFQSQELQKERLKIISKEGVEKEKKHKPL